MYPTGQQHYGLTPPFLFSAISAYPNSQPSNGIPTKPKAPLHAIKVPPVPPSSNPAQSQDQRIYDMNISQMLILQHLQKTFAPNFQPNNQQPLSALISPTEASFVILDHAPAPQVDSSNLPISIASIIPPTLSLLDFNNNNSDRSSITHRPILSMLKSNLAANSVTDSDPKANSSNHKRKIRSLELKKSKKIEIEKSNAETEPTQIPGSAPTCSSSSSPILDLQSKLAVLNRTVQLNRQTFIEGLDDLYAFIEDLSEQ